MNRYYGDFENLVLYPESGAYHRSDLNMVFGTAQDTSGLPNSAVENATSRYMMRAWAAFARDPRAGLVSELGWTVYESSNASTFVKLAYVNETTISFVPPGETDGECAALNGATNLGDGAM